eukprot:gnl/TRDRNA2_/TRDRNA2_154607_c0_seq1.p1 gnl/TRDRNA2_/TRDRNA2_154607_c0~~gnl/TRDRNA2_/TRDRNA2_154607_c0_seq1.p1  ORF type:complete len:307 (+),score=67.98 gnl/TRDRNA2_/TRDRNA2_154607_c0_seq1:129-923(+)
MAAESATKDAEARQGAVLGQALAAARLTTARRGIQAKYLEDLKQCPEVNRTPDPSDPARTNTRAGNEPLVVLEVPLLASEVTGQAALLDFSYYLVGKELGDRATKFVAVEDEQTKIRRSMPASEKKQGEEQAQSAPEQQSAGEGIKSMANSAIDAVLNDPELAKMVAENPKLAEVIKVVRENPLAGLQYMMDPEVGPFVQKAMGKLMGGGGGGIGGLAQDTAANSINMPAAVLMSLFAGSGVVISMLGCRRAALTPGEVPILAA